MLSRLLKILFFITLLPINSIAENPPLKIGLSLPLSGPFQEYGTAVRNAFSMASEEMGGGGYELVYEDNQYDPKLAVTNFNILVDLRQIDLLYIWGEICLYPVAPLASIKKLPILAMSTDKEPAKNSPYVIRTANPSRDYVSEYYKYSRIKIPSNSTGSKRIGVLMSEDPFFEGLVTELNAQVQKGEEIIVLAKVPSSQMDLKAELIRAKASELDLLAIYLNPGQVSSAYRSMRNLGIKTPTFGTDIFESRTEVKDSQYTMVGSTYPNLNMPQEFQAKYFKKYGNDLQVTYAYNAYATANFILSKTKELQNAKEKGSDLKDEIIKLLLAEKNLPFEV